MVNKQGQTRLAQYYQWLTLDERRALALALEGEIVRKCLARTEQQCSFVEHRNYNIVFRRYASLFFLVGVDNDEVFKKWLNRFAIFYEAKVVHYYLCLLVEKIHANFVDANDANLCRIIAV